MATEPHTFKYVAVISCCPGVGACGADYCWHVKKAPPTRPKIDLSDKSEETLKKLSAYISEVKEDPSPVPTCTAPIQVTMGDQPVPICKNPDALCTLCTHCFAVRVGVAFFIVFTLAGSVMLSKWVIFCYGAFMVGCCLALTTLACILSLICPNSVRNTKSMHTLFLQTVSLKVSEKNEEKQAAQKGEKIKFKAKQLWESFKSLLVGICCCQLCRPISIFTLAKTLTALLFTDVLMAASIWLYMAGRFVVGSFTWTACSFVSWMQELIVAGSIKERLTFFGYPDFASHVKGGAFVPAPDLEAQQPGCCNSCCGSTCGCTSCKCVTCCGCDLMCGLCEPFCGQLCELFADFVGDVFGALLLLGKALLYTREHIKEDVEVMPAPVIVGQAWKAER